MRYSKPIDCGKKLALASIVILMGACNTMTGSADLKRMATTNTLAFCDAARPIYWSRKDTLETITQVKTHNAVGKLCGWGVK